MTTSHSNDIELLVDALIKAQSEIKPVAMDATNPFLKTRYASLGSVIESTRVPLSKNGLTVIQTVGGGDGVVSVTTLLVHTSGQWVSDTASLRLNDEKGKSAAQVAGSIVTYLRRYGLSSIVGAYTDEDTDGARTEAPAKPAAKVVPYDWSKRPGELVKRVADIPYFEGDTSRAINALKYLQEHKSINPGMKDDEIFEITNKAAGGWADQKAAKKGE